MCCSNIGVIPVSDPRFSLLPTITRFTTTTTFTKGSISFATRLPNPAIRTLAVSCRTKAAFHDGSVGTPAMEAETEAMSFYDLLGISETGTVGEIKQAYKQLARKYHPDVSPPDRVDEYTRRFIRVQEAYETLSDPWRRALYDSDMARGLHLAFSARRRYQNDEQMEERSEWKSRWQAQLSGLKRRSMNKEAQGNNMSWGARMRRQRNEPSAEL